MTNYSHTWAHIRMSTTLARVGSLPAVPYGFTFRFPSESGRKRTQVYGVRCPVCDAMYEQR